MGDSALVALSELQQRPLTPAFRDRLSRVRNGALTLVAERQGDWRGWTWRGARRLKRARALGGQRALAQLIACGCG
jgi:hypothetical protein